MKKKTYYYKRMMKRIIKWVQYYIDHPDTVDRLALLNVNPVIGDVVLDDYTQDGDYLFRHAMFLTKRDANWTEIPDERSIEHWVLTDLKRFFSICTTSAQLPLRSL